MGPLPEHCTNEDPTPPASLVLAIREHNANCRLFFNLLIERWQVWEEHRKHPGEWSCALTWEDPDTGDYLPATDAIMESLREWDMARLGSPQAVADEFHRRRKAKEEAQDRQFKADLRACLSGDEKTFRRFVDDTRPVGLSWRDLVAQAESEKEAERDEG